MNCCEAVLINSGIGGSRKKGEPCGAAAAFVSRGHDCCYIHHQADTRGPRAGKVVFGKVKK